MTGFWQGRRVLVTGHTGFKGAWLCLWLHRLGAEVSAFALPAETVPSLADIFAVNKAGRRASVDVRDGPAVSRQVKAASPEIVFHLAAQALVRRSYQDPVDTFATNVMGTVNVLSALRSAPDVKAVVVVTTDKVYRNDCGGRPFDEDDPLGGKDPYSSSKACAEFATRAFRDSYFEHGPALATARAGNVVGGGDWSADRLVPDFIRALESNQPIRLRYPEAVRPWQHVLEPLAGYLSLAQTMVERPADAPDSVNFGPDPQNFTSVSRVAESLEAAFQCGTSWQRDPGDHPPEASVLTLNSDRAASTLDWRPRLSLDDTLDWTASWYRAHREGQDMHAFSLGQIAAYEGLVQ